MSNKDTKESKTPNTQPIKTVREGAIGASIWLETAAEGVEYTTFTISRAFKSKRGEQGYSKKFFARNRAALHEVIDQACDALEAFENGDDQPNLNEAA